MTREDAKETEGAKDAARGLLGWALVSLAYAVLGLAVLVPEAIYSGDIGVKYVQAHALAANGYDSLDLDYPGSSLDPRRDFFPIRPPFVMNIVGTTQAIFPPAAAILQSVLVSVAGLRGLIIGSVLSGAVILWAALRMAAPGTRLMLMVALGVASPLWFYAVSGTEHGPAVAFATAAFAIALRSTWRGSCLVAGLLLGVAIVLRDEALLLTPGLCLVVGVRSRSPMSVVAALAGVLLPFAIAVGVEVEWFGRPPASHLRHAVYLEGAELSMTGAGGAPIVSRLSLRERYEALVVYWLLGWGEYLPIAFLTLAGAVWVRRFRANWASMPLFLWLLGILLLALADAWEVVTAPKWIGGLHRLTPFLVFALLPAPAREGREWFHRAVLLSTAVFLGVAFVTMNTTGGKSLGPRLLLPLLPLLAIVAVARIQAYRLAELRVDRWIGGLGVALIVAGILLHPFGSVRAYYERNRIDGSAVVAAERAAPRVIVADDVFTAHLLLPLYYRKIIFLADSDRLGGMLGAQLATANVHQVLVVSRRPQPATTLPPLKLQQVSRVGRMVMQHWGQ
jgi:hypothetical protein